MQLIDESFDNSMLLQQQPLAHLNKAKSFFDGNMSYIHQDGIGPFAGGANQIFQLNTASMHDSSILMSGQQMQGLYSSNAYNSLVDPESSIALGQEAGLIGALRENGFDFYIDFREL